MKRQPIPQATVLAWLAEHQPQLEAVIERHWIWIASSLQGDEHAAEREALKTMLDGNGFKFARKGHTLPDGRVAYWAHACACPTRFHRHRTATAEQAGNSADWEQARQEALAFLSVQPL